MAKRKFTDEIYSELCAEFESYINSHADPIIAGFIISPIARKYHVTDDDLSAPAYPRLYELSQVAIKKQEYYLQREGLVMGAPMAIFRLKQRWHGFTDRTEQNITTTTEHVQFFNTLPRHVKDKDKKQAKDKK